MKITDLERSLNTELDIQYGYNNSPIKTYTEMPKPLKWNKQGIDAKWKKSLETKWWSQNFIEIESLSKDQLKLRTFADRLLTFGGNEVCIPELDEDLYNYETRGQLWYGTESRLIRGTQSQCHANSAALWEVNRNHARIKIATGYALSKNDGMWRQHSWCVLKQNEKVHVVETTTRREGYFGYVLTDQEADEFYVNNVY